MGSQRGCVDMVSTPLRTLSILVAEGGRVQEFLVFLAGNECCSAKPQAVDSLAAYDLWNEGLHRFKDRGDALAGADAHGRQAELRLAVEHGVNKGGGDAGSGGAER